MKLLTLNTHSIVEENYENKLKTFVDAVIEEKPDIIAMQEVNQSRFGHNVEGIVDGMIDNGVKIKADNHAFRVANMLNQSGLFYYWVWLPIKIGYGLYEEGVALFSRWPITNIDSFYISDIDDYNNWRTRMVLGIEVKEQWFYSVHMGWWNDKTETFKEQWDRLLENLVDCEKIWLMGDFNNSSDVRDEGYDSVIESGWYDTYSLAKTKDGGITVNKAIDGWKKVTQDMRIDYIFSNSMVDVYSSKVIFNGDNRDAVSDHFGVIVEVNE